MICIYSGILVSHKKNKIMPFIAIWMQLKIIILSEVRKRNTNTIRFTYMRNLEYDTNEPIYEIETESRTKRTDL